MCITIGQANQALTREIVEEIDNFQQITEIIIAQGVTEIGEGAFSNCNALSSVTIPSTVTKIGKIAFQNCNGLQTVNGLENVTEIGDYAFSGCIGLEQVEILGKPKIGKKAFDGYSKPIVCNKVLYYSPVTQNGNKYTINIPAEAEEIAPGAFQDNNDLTHLIIPEQVKSIGWYAFSGCNNLQAVIWKSEGNVFNEQRKIGGCAFSGCTNLTTVAIPACVSEIGNAAFEGCCQLRDLRIFRTQIGRTNMLPENLKSIGDYAFSGCSNLSLKKIPSGVLVIGKYAFMGFANLNPNPDDIEIPSSVKQIGEGSFSRSGVRKVDMKNAREKNSAALTIGKYAFSDCKVLESVIIPSHLMEIGDGAFWGCTKLQLNDIKDSVKIEDTIIGRNVFSFCEEIKANKITKDYDIDSEIRVTRANQSNSPLPKNKYVYSGKVKWIKLNIPDTVKTIEKRVFLDCTNLIEVNIPATVTTIEKEAFRNCKNLKKVTFNQNSNLTTIENSAFSGCTSLKYFNSEREGEVKIPSEVNKIGWGAFANCTGLKSIKVPATTQMEYGAFFCCTNLTEVESVSQGNSNGVTLDKTAFAGCDLLNNQRQMQNNIPSILKQFMPEQGERLQDQIQDIITETRIIEIIRDWMRTPYDWKGKDEVDTILEFYKYSDDFRKAKGDTDRATRETAIETVVKNILKWGGIDQQSSNAVGFSRIICDALNLPAQTWDPTNDQDKVSSWSKLYAAYSIACSMSPEKELKFIYDSRVALSLSYISLHVGLPSIWAIPSSRGEYNREWKLFTGMCDKRNGDGRHQDISNCYARYHNLLKALANNDNIIMEYRRLDPRILEAYRAIGFTEPQAIMAHLEKVLFMKKDDILAPFKPAEERNIEQNDQDAEEEESEYPE